MRIDRKKMSDHREKYEGRPPDQKGPQPGIFYSCFLGRGKDVERDCMNCAHFKVTCRSYLLGFRVEERPNASARIRT